MTHNAYDDQQPCGDSGGRIDPTKKERYYQAVREHESREAQLNTQLELRQRSAAEVRQRQFGLLETWEREYNADRAQGKQNLDTARLDLEEAQRSASEHCSEIAVPYVPGSTTEADILSVSQMEEAEAAKQLNLSFGVGFHDTFVKLIKPILTLFCWGTAALSLGLGFRLLDAKDIFNHPANVGYSLVLGGMVAFGVLLAVTWMWKPLGTKYGSSRPAKEVEPLLYSVVLLTALILIGMAYLDGKTLLLLNAARAALNPLFQIPLPLALLMGLLISGTYVLGLVGAAFADGYNAAATKSIVAEIKGDENRKRDMLRQKMPVKEALEALGNLKIAEAAVAHLEKDLRRMKQEFERERAEMLAALPEVPTALEPDEIEELTNLRDRARSQKANFDAHVISRSAIINNDNNDKTV